MRGGVTLMVSDFYRLQNLSDEASEIVERYLLGNGDFNTLDVYNVEHNKVYQQRDVDLLWTMTAKNKVYYDLQVEVKGLSKIFNYKGTETLPFETVSNTNTGSSGWTFYTTADYLVYYAREDQRLIMLRAKPTVAYFKQVYNKRKAFSSSTKGYHSQEIYYSSKFINLTIEELERKGCILYDVNLADVTLGTLTEHSRKMREAHNQQRTTHSSSPAMTSDEPNQPATALGR